MGFPDGRGKVGRPELMWMYCTENGLKSMGVKKWGKTAEDRSAWAVHWLNCKDRMPMKKKKKKKKKKKRKN